MSEIAISATSLAKKYRIGVRRDPYGRLTETLWSAMTRPFRSGGNEERADDFWALRDVSFEVPRGSVVGIIGQGWVSGRSLGGWMPMARLVTLRAP